MNKVKTSLVLSILMIVGIITFTIINTGTTLYNNMDSMTATIINEIEPYETEYVYIDSIPSTAEKVVLQEGVNGLDYTYDGLNYVHLSEKSNEVIQVGTGKEGDYTGKLTGYGPDCPGCSKVGNVSCLTKEGRRHSLINDGVYYKDLGYGDVRILAADNSAFPCGTIVKVNNSNIDEFYGIVLDSGSSMRNAWKQGIVWMDLAFKTEAEARVGGVTNSNTKFSVQRWGW